MLGRQGFIGATTRGTAVSVPWNGTWKEAWFVDNNDSIRRPNAPDPLPYHYSSTNRNGVVQHRNTPLGAITTEKWEYPQWDIQAKVFQPATPLGSSVYLGGIFYKNPFQGNSVNMAYKTQTDPNFSPFRHYINTEQFTVTATEMAGHTDIDNMTFQFGLHRGTIRNVTTGVAVTPTTPSMLPTDTGVVDGNLPAIFGVLPVKLGDVIEIVAGTVISNISALLPILLPEFGLPTGNSGFYSRDLSYPYRRTSISTGDGWYITDRGSPQSLQGVRWIDAIYPDVPAYKLDFDVLFNNQNTRVDMVYQGGSLNTSSLVLNNDVIGSRLRGHSIIDSLVQAPLAIGTWHSVSVALYPSDPSDPLTPTGWMVELSLGGTVINKSITYDPALMLTYIPDIPLGSLAFYSDKPILMRNIRMSYWERL